MTTVNESTEEGQEEEGGECVSDRGSERPLGHFVLTGNTDLNLSVGLQ